MLEIKKEKSKDIESRDLNKCPPGRYTMVEDMLPQTNRFKLALETCYCVLLLDQLWESVPFSGESHCKTLPTKMAFLGQTEERDSRFPRVRLLV